MDISPSVPLVVYNVYDCRRKYRSVVEGYVIDAPYDALKQMCDEFDDLMNERNGPSSYPYYDDDDDNEFMDEFELAMQLCVDSKTPTQDTTAMIALRKIFPFITEDAAMWKVTKWAETGSVGADPFGPLYRYFEYHYKKCSCR